MGWIVNRNETIDVDIRNNGNIESFKYNNTFKKTCAYNCNRLNRNSDSC